MRPNNESNPSSQPKDDLGPNIGTSTHADNSADTGNTAGKAPSMTNPGTPHSNTTPNTKDTRQIDLFELTKMQHREKSSNCDNHED